MGISELSGTTILSVLCILLMIAFVSLGALHIITERRHRQELYCYDDEKDGLFSTPSSPTSVPEIRLTFPDGTFLFSLYPVFSNGVHWLTG